MLIGISGKISSGKDTVGKIICYLTAQQKLHKDWKHVKNIEFDHSILQFINNETPKDFLYNKVFNIKKYADKLKDFVCILIGCTREQLEDHEFKNKELGEEWDKFAFYRENTIKPLRIYSYREEAEKDVQIFKGGKVEILKMTPRLLLQIIGTECIRDKVHPNAWVNALFADYKSNLCDNGIFATIKMENGSTISWIPNPILEPNSYPNWIITDMRFPNELEAVKSRGGISIRVNRDKTNNEVTEKERISYARNQLKSKYGIEISEYPNEVSIKTDEHLYKNGKLNSIYVAEFNELCDSYKRKEFKEHPSETALDDAEFDYTIENNSTIEDLIHTVSLILKREKII